MTIYLDNDFESEVTITRKNTSTGAEEAATGLTGMTHHLSASDSGVTIHADVSVNSAERGSLGIYYGLILGENLRAQLASYVGSTVWEVIGDGTGIYVSEPHRVLATRRPG